MYTTDQQDSNPIIRRNEKDKIVAVLVKNINDTLNINGKWGCGKTFLSKLVQADLNQDVSNKVIALRINISDYSYVNDPLVLFIVTILDYINDDNNIIADEIKHDLLKSISCVISIISWASLLLDQSGTIKTIIDNMKDACFKDKPDGKTPNNQLEASLMNVKSYQKAINELDKSIELICTSLDKNKIIIFVDDFDRVNPEFAFRVLNIIHQFKEKILKLQICTIMNRKQFESQLCHLYGQNDNDEHYLTKYIDLEITVTNPILNNPKEFLKEFKIPAKLDQFMFLRGWLSLLSVREVQIFSMTYRGKLYEHLDDNYELQRILQEDNNVAYYIVLLYIILIKFDLDFKSFNAKLSNAQDCLVLIKKLKTFYSNVADKKHYENYTPMESSTGNTSKLENISNIAFSFLSNKINLSSITPGLTGDFTARFDKSKSLMNEAYKEYFKLVVL